MKAVAVLFSSVALLGAAVAQDYDSLPACGKTCITNLLNDAPAFGCSTTNEASCLCANATFSYGIRDCSNEACDDSANAASVIDYGVAYCSSAGVAIPTTVQTVTSGSATATGTASGTGAGSSASGGGAVAISTSSYVTTITTDGSTITSSAASTIFSSGAASSLSGAASSLSSAASSLSGAASSAGASASSEASAATSSAGSAASSAGSAASSAASGAASGTSSSAAFAPQMTAAPIGFLAAAGVAAMLL